MARSSTAILLKDKVRCGRISLPLKKTRLPNASYFQPKHNCIDQQFARDVSECPESCTKIAKNRIWSSPSYLDLSSWIIFSKFYYPIQVYLQYLDNRILSAFAPRLNLTWDIYHWASPGQLLSTRCFTNSPTFSSNTMHIHRLLVEENKTGEISGRSGKKSKPGCWF